MSVVLSVCLCHRIYIYIYIYSANILVEDGEGGPEADGKLVMIYLKNSITEYSPIPWKSEQKGISHI